MVFKIHKNKQDKIEKSRIVNNINKAGNHGSFSIDEVKKHVEEEGLSLEEKINKRVDERIMELEKIGYKKWRRGKIFTVVGITFMFLIGLYSMYLGFMILSDIIDLVERADKSIIDTADIENKRIK